MRQPLYTKDLTAAITAAIAAAIEIMVVVLNLPRSIFSQTHPL